MKWINSSIVTSDLFLELELLMYKKTIPSLQAILNFNEIIELVVLKEKLLMPTTDHIAILKILNMEKIKKLGGEKKINWIYEIKNLGKANLKKPIITTMLFEEGILILDTEQSKDKAYREFGDKLFSNQCEKDWMLKTIGFGIKDKKRKDFVELSYIKGFNNTIKNISSDPLYWKMVILAAPDLAPDIKKKFGYDYSWTYRYYREIEVYTKFAKKKNLGFSDNVLMQPFIALNFQPSKNFIEIFYKKLKDARNEEITKFLELQKPWNYYLPPLTTILLQRCKSIENLPIELIKLRNEFKNLRESLTNYQTKFEDADTIKEKIEIKKEFQDSIELFIRKIRKPRKRIIKQIIDFTIEQSNGIINKDFEGPIKKIVGKIAEYIYFKKIFPWIDSFIHLLDKSLEIKVDVNIYEKIFGNINLNYLDDINLFAKNSYKFLEGIKHKNS